MPHTLLRPQHATVEGKSSLQFSLLTTRVTARRASSALHCSSHYPICPRSSLHFPRWCSRSIHCAYGPFRHVLEIPLVPSVRSPVSTCTVHTLLRYRPWLIHLHTCTWSFMSCVVGVGDGAGTENGGSNPLGIN
jgi:hypothetical protein